MRLQSHGKGFREQCTIIHVVHLVVGNVPFLGLVQTLISSRQEMQNLEEKEKEHDMRSRRNTWSANISQHNTRIRRAQAS